MCGICGKLNLDSKKVTADTIASMCSVITHRGPDDEGIYLDGSMGMGMRRLSIIDLNTGHQPISNEDATVWTVLNGEIYNYKELTAELVKKGHVFKTKSDTEVIVHLYEEHGSEFVSRLRGMFGLAVWDSKKKELIVARDPLGIKQVYFLRETDAFLFASEIKSILQVLDKKREVNVSALKHYLTFLYFPEELTIFKDIYKILPGHYLRVTAQSIRDVEYWNLNKISPVEIGFAEAQTQLVRLMEESMMLHLRSDVPLGVFLSGGVDSSIITALGARLTDKPLNTFTIGYGKEGSFYDEREYARLIAKRFKTNHYEYAVGAPDIEDTIHKLVYFFDEPFANSSAVPNFYISQMMRKQVKVALSGLGGDEIAGGYERYAGMNVLAGFKRLPILMKRLALAFAEALPDSKKGSYFSNRLKRFMRAAGLPEREAYYSLVTFLNDEKKRSIFSKQNQANTPGDDSFALFSGIMDKSRQEDILKSAMYFDIVSYATNDLLVLSDRTSMANSLEVRVPFFDHKLAEFMFSLPSEYKVRGMEKKYILRKAFGGVLPKKILSRKKRGFSTPLSVWLRNDLKEFSRSVFSKKEIEATGVLDHDGIQALLEEHLQRKANHQGVLFALMTFIIWHQKYIQNDPRSFTKGLKL